MSENPNQFTIDLFIASAPDEPQPWFEPDMPPKPIPPKLDDFFSIAQQEERKMASAWFKDPCFDLYDQYNSSSVKYRAFSDAVKAYWKALAEWDAERVKQRYVQWPRAWANEMMKRRS